MAGLLVGTGQGLGGLAGGAATARLLVVISGNSSGLSAAVAQATGSLSSFNKNASTLGGAMTRSLTLPLLGIGAASVALAAQFEQSMARVRGLTPLTFGEVAKAEEQILALSKKVPTAPADLADSLYYAGSAGLAFGDAMDIVELSAKGAAIGMGDAADISKVLIFALNTFGGPAFDAANAMDALTVAIKEGTAEPDEMAIALGRLLPIAKQVGLSFEEVVGQVASLTNIGVPTRVATTSLRALFTQLMAPTIRAKDNLEALGISSADLREAVEAGPIVAFELLNSAAKGNEDVLHAIIPQIRALTAYYGLMGDRADESADILNKVRDSTGALDKAFTIMSKTPLFQFQLGLNNLRLAGIEMGKALMPAFTGLANILASVGRAFAGLPGPMKTAAAGLLLVVASAGPLIRIYGALIDNGAGLFSSFRSITAGSAVMAAGLLAAIVGFSSMAKGSTSLVNALMVLVGTFALVRLGLKALQTIAVASLGRAASGAAISRLTTGLISLGAAATPIAGVIAGVALAISYAIGKTTTWESSVKSLNESMAEVSNTSKTLGEVAKEMASAEGAGNLEHAFNRVVIAAGLQNKTLMEGLDLLRAYADEQMHAAAAAGDVPYQNVYHEIANQAGMMYDRLKEQTEAALILHSAEQQQLEELADQWGVTAADVSAAASEMGVDVVGLTDANEEWFGQEAEFIDDTGAFVYAIKQRREAERELIEGRQENLRSNLLGQMFEKDIGAVKGSTQKLLQNMDRQAQAARDFASNVASLRLTGLDPAALQFLVDQGPGMVAKFVDASKQELKQLEINYAATLGAVDAAILNEGDHQEGKGKHIVTLFTQGILSNKNLPPGAASRIVKQVTDAFSRGKVDEAGVRLVTDFSAKIAGTRHLPRAAAAQVMQAVTNAIIAGDLKGAGARQVASFAQGMASRMGLPKKQAQTVITLITETFRQKTDSFKGYGTQGADGYARGIEGSAPKARTAGAGLVTAVLGPLATVPAAAGAYGRGAGSQFASGINAYADSAYNAGRNVANRAKEGFKDGLANSPEYFTYPMGQNLVEELNRGMASRRVAGIGRPGVDIGRVGRRTSGGGGGDTNVYIDARGSVFANDRDYARMAAKMKPHMKRALRHDQKRSAEPVLGHPS